MSLDFIPITLPPLFPPVHQCRICGKDCPPDFGVAYCCGPTHDEIGSMSSEYSGTEVGGATACKLCHDQHYGFLAVPDLSSVDFVFGCPWCRGSLVPYHPQTEFYFEVADSPLPTGTESARLP